MSKKHDFQRLNDWLKDADLSGHHMTERQACLLKNFIINHRKTIQYALRLAPLLEKVKDECDSLMSHAEHKKKIASMDFHDSEINHQDGRWHCANDIEKFITQLMKEVENE